MNNQRAIDRLTKHLEWGWSKKTVDAMFENDVKMYGIQTKDFDLEYNTLFENDVKMYGIQTVSLEQAIDQLV